MPINRADYPADWEAVAQRVKDRAGWVCQWPGCHAKHGQWIARRIANPEQWMDCSYMLDEIATFGPVRDPSILRPPMRGVTRPLRVIITAAHLCGCRPICGDDGHIVALCQLHHLWLDARERVISAAANRRRRELLRGQGFLFADIDEPSAAGRLV